MSLFLVPENFFQSLKSGLNGVLLVHLHLRQATFQVFSGHVWLVAVVLAEQVLKIAPDSETWLLNHTALLLPKHSNDKHRRRGARRLALNPQRQLLPGGLSSEYPELHCLKENVMQAACVI